MANLKECKFLKDLAGSNESIKTRRAGLIASQVERAQKSIVDGYEEEIQIAEEKLEVLSDLSPTSTTSLKMGTSSDFNAVQWCKDIEALKLQIIELRVKQKSAQETYDSWFSEVSENASTEA